MNAINNNKASLFVVIIQSLKIIKKNEHIRFRGESQLREVLKCVWWHCSFCKGHIKYYEGWEALRAPIPAADGSLLPWGSTSGCAVTAALGVSTGAGGHGWMGCQACEGPPALAGKRQESYPIRRLLRPESTLLSWLPGEIGRRKREHVALLIVQV